MLSLNLNHWSWSRVLFCVFLTQGAWSWRGEERRREEKERRGEGRRGEDTGCMETMSVLTADTCSARLESRRAERGKCHAAGFPYGRLPLDLLYVSFVVRGYSVSWQGGGGAEGSTALSVCMNH